MRSGTLRMTKHPNQAEPQAQRAPRLNRVSPGGSSPAFSHEFSQANSTLAEGLSSKRLKREINGTLGKDKLLSRWDSSRDELDGSPVWGREGGLRERGWISFQGAGVAQRMRCAPRLEKHRLNWFLNPSFGWNRRSIPQPTAQFIIAVVSLTNSGTVPEFFTARAFAGTVPEILMPGIARSEDRSLEPYGLPQGR
jgi:hypothetical protein